MVAGDTGQRIGGGFRPSPVTILVDGEPVSAYPGESLAAALLASGRRRFRVTGSGRPRGPLCNMGVCFDCVVSVERLGAVRACMTPVEEGLNVHTDVAGDGAAVDASPAGAPARAEVAIVGAGPAGLAAAALLSEHGADVAVIDERPRAGGQIYRLPPESFAAAGLPPGRSYAAGRTLLAAALAADLRWLLGTLVWGLFEPPDAGLMPAGSDDRWVLALAGERSVERLAVGELLIAAGAYDLPVAFPGWTLPGVMSAGGVQAFIKSDKLLPGGRFVLAGGHPLLLIVADQLLSAGAELGAVAFAQQRPRLGEVLAAGARLGGQLAPVLELAGPLRRLRRAGVPLLFGHLPVAADGDEALESVELAPVDGRWRRSGGATVRFACDTLACGFGFVPSVELARQVGCSLRWEPGAGGWVANHDEWMCSSVPGIALAGELTGVAGAEQAAVEGRLAAVGILLRLGALDAAQAERAAAPLRAQLRRQRRFSALVRQRFQPAYGALAELADDDTVVCRCEEVTAGELRQTLEANPHLGSADAVKLITRAGMGACQGRFCMLTVASMIAAQTGRDFATIGAFHARPPAKPVSISKLSAAWQAST